MSLKQLNNVVVVTRLEDLPAPITGNITLVDNLTYQINGTVSLGTNTITLGVSNTIFGLDKSNDKLVYTGTSAMINGTNQDITIGVITLTASTAGGSVFNLTGTTNKMEIRECIFTGSASLGTINGGAFLIFRANLMTANSAGLTLQGTMGYVAIADTFWVSNSSTITCISIPSGTFTELKITRNIFNVVATQTALNIAIGVVVTVGIVELCDFIGVGNYLTGINHTSPNWNLRDNRNITNTFTFIPRAIERSWGNVRATNATRISSGITTSTFGASAAVANDNTTNYTGYTSTATTGSFAGLETTSFAEIRPDWSPVFSAVIKTDAVITNVRYWVGFVSATITNADDQGGAYCAFRFSTVAGDTGWTPIVDTGSVNTPGTTMGTVVANTQYKLEIQIDFANTKTYFRVNGGTWTTISAIPPTGTSLGLAVELVTTTNTAKTINFSRLDINHN